MRRRTTVAVAAVALVALVGVTLYASLASSPAGGPAPATALLSMQVAQLLDENPGGLVAGVTGVTQGPAAVGGCTTADLTAVIGTPLLQSLDVCRGTVTVTTTGPAAGETHVFGVLEVQTTEQGTEVAASLFTQLPTDRTAVANGKLVVLLDRDASLDVAKALVAVTAGVQK